MAPDEATIRQAALATTHDDGALLLAPADIAQVVTEEGWAALALATDALSYPALGRLQRQLAAALPGAAVEVRAGNRVHRGGGGFGAGRHVVAVLGGKGGVGKSTVSVNLAITLSALGARAGLLDADLNGPDVPHMLGVRPAQQPRASGAALFGSRITPPSRRRAPLQRYGVETWSVGFILPEGLPTSWTGRMLVAALLRWMVFDLAWAADVLVIDMPPGTGEELQVLTGELPLSAAVFVTTPQDLAQMDAERTLTLLRERGVPVIGMVQNMASLVCPHCRAPIDLFGLSTRLQDAGVPILGRIPFDTTLSVAADQGYPLVLGNPTGPIAYEFARIGSAVRRWLDGRDA